MIRNRIIRGELAPGSSLPPEGVLLEELGISRPTLREATRILESEALINVQRGAKGGSVVLGPSSMPVAESAARLLQNGGATLGDIYDARLLLEPAAAASLATDVGEPAAAALELLNDRARVAPEEQDRVEFVAQLHEQVLGLTGNPVTALFGRLITEMLELHHRRDQADAIEGGDSVGEVGQPRAEPAADARGHLELVAAIRARDGAAAAQAWTQHLLDARDRELQPDGPSTPLDVLI